MCMCELEMEVKLLVSGYVFRVCILGRKNGDKKGVKERGYRKN